MLNFLVEQKQLKQKKKQMQQQLRQEERLLAAAHVWNKEILPNWDVMYVLQFFFSLVLILHLNSQGHLAPFQL